MGYGLHESSVANKPKTKPMHRYIKHRFQNSEIAQLLLLKIIILFVVNFGFKKPDLNMSKTLYKRENFVDNLYSSFYKHLRIVFNRFQKRKFKWYFALRDYGVGNAITDKIYNAKAIQ